MKTSSDGNSRLVYSSEQGSVCPACGRRRDRCTCGRKAPAPKSDGIVRVGRSTQGRKGKGVTLISGMPGDEAQLRQTAKILKQKCGSGGTVKEGVIEIQGDHRDQLVAELQRMGHTVRRSGG